MKKFNALLFAMALVAVVAFASVASATVTKFLGVSNGGDVVVISVDPDKTTGNKITYEGNVITGAPHIGNDGHSTVKAFDYDGGIVIVSTDATDENATGAKVYTFTADDDGDFQFVKSYNGRISGDINDVVTLNGSPVILARKSIATVSNDKLIAFCISNDVAFMYNSKLYVVSDDIYDPAKTTGGIFEFSDINADWNEKLSINSLQEGTTTGVISRDINIKFPVAVANGTTSSVVIGDRIYITTGNIEDKGGSFDVIAIPTAGNSFMETTSLKIDKLDSTYVSSIGEYYALYNKDDALYTLEGRNNDFYLTKLTLNSDKTAFTRQETILSSLKSAMNTGTTIKNISCDIYIADKVIGVVNHGKALAIFTEENGAWNFVESYDFKTAAMVTTASSGADGDGEKPAEKTVVDASTLATASQDNLVAATPASAISDFVTAEEASTTTVPTGAQAAIEAELKKDDNTTVTLAAKTNYTPDKDGYILVKEAVDVSKVTVYFVEAATTTTTAATGDATKATLLDADCKEMGSTGTSVYAASDKLESGKTYTLVEATVSSTSGGDDEGEGGSTTSSSSGGCDAGFAAVSALLALAFFKKSR